jgi:arylsulfatase A-like enzyme
VVFDRASSVAPLTLPAHTSLLTGVFPPGHGVRDNADDPLAPSHSTLAEVLRGKGYCTGAFVSSVVLDSSRGLAQGFQHYAGVSADNARGARRNERPADEVIGDAIRWLDDAGACPLFLWAHLYDPHRPYEPPEPFRSRHFDPYVGEIAFVDSQIGRLLDLLDHRQLLERTVVVVAGDHGESLGEHGEDGHGIFVYESVLRVPLIIRTPRGGRAGEATGRRVGEVVRLVDVMPTILDLIGLDTPRMDGVTLAGLLRGKESGLGLEAYAESMYPERLGWSALRTVSDGRFKFIEAPRPELYDLARDPFETENIYNERRTAAEAMRRRLDSVATAGSRPDGRRSEVDVPADLRERLDALGYVTSTAPLTTALAGDRPDPKDCMAARDQTRGGQPAASAGRPILPCNTPFRKGEEFREDSQARSR